MTFTHEVCFSKNPLPVMIRGLLLFFRPYTLSSLTYFTSLGDWRKSQKLKHVKKLPRRRIETKKLLAVAILFEAVFLVSKLRLKGLILVIHLTGIYSPYSEAFFKF